MSYVDAVWAVTAVGIGLYAARVLRRARVLGNMGAEQESK